MPKQKTFLIEYASTGYGVAETHRVVVKGVESWDEAIDVLWDQIIPNFENYFMISCEEIKLPATIKMPNSNN